MIFTAQEITDMIASTLILGYVFKDMVVQNLKRTPEDWIKGVKKSGWKREIEETLYSSLILAPALILHEMGHKYTAIFFGANATYHAAYFWLFIALLLKFARSPFIFFVPAYIGIIGQLTPLQSAIVAFDGPFMNFLLYLITILILKLKPKKYTKELRFFAQINLFLFIFNLIPIPGFDGFKVLMGILQAL